MNRHQEASRSPFRANFQSIRPVGTQSTSLTVPKLPPSPPRSSPAAARFVADSPLEERRFELLVPQSILLGGVNAGRHGGAYPSCLFSTRTSHKSGARQCYRSRAATPSAERPVSSRL